MAEPTSFVSLRTKEDNLRPKHQRKRINPSIFQKKLKNPRQIRREKQWWEVLENKNNIWRVKEYADLQNILLQRREGGRAQIEQDGS